ncbi:MAG: PIN domain-containing protein [Chloroflexi bacterium]|nr:PIN domain-containing protein [Chloroflexota bacterium]
MDTSHHVAVIDYRDALHDRALRLADELGQSPANTFITAEAVLMELLTFFSNKGPHMRDQAAAYVERLRTASPTIIIPQTPALFDAAFDLYRRRRDKTYSMVDCIGMVICQQQRITSVLTADRDFAQEGLVVLLD